VRREEAGARRRQDPGKPHPVVIDKHGGGFWFGTMEGAASIEVPLHSKFLEAVS
jgi:hypothetical protein